MVRQYLRGLGWRGAVLVAAMVLLAMAAVLEEDDEDVEEPEGSIAVRERAETVFDWSSQACEPHQYPDLPARAFRDATGQVQLVLSHFTNYRMVGPSLGELRVDCTAVMASGNDPHPADFNDREWIASLYTENGRDVWALVHNEYQGHLHPGMCPGGGYLPCWYNSVTLARSADAGRSYFQAAASGHLVASSSQRYRPGVGPSGVFAPSNIVEGPGDGYLYALFQLIEPNGARGVCLARTREPGDPRSWRAWDGTAFEDAFVNPYELAGPVPEPACRPIAPAEVSEMHESLTYNGYLDRYVLVGMATTGSPATSGIYYSLSEDLLNWTPRRLLLRAPSVNTYRCGGPDPIAYPSLIDPSSPSPTFSTGGRRPYLYYTRFHYRDCARTEDRDLVRVPLEVTTR